ncbi:hypothetical protein J6590_006517 [Homalodisca vitripennis]|nr:hypothetical protein J6590_006517 [Homalodisca vitripennis]
MIVRLLLRIATFGKLSLLILGANVRTCCCGSVRVSSGDAVTLFEQLLVPDAVSGVPARIWSHILLNKSKKYVKDENQNKPVHRVVIKFT